MQPTNYERLTATFREVLGVPGNVDVSRVRQLTHAAWDSLGHVTLMAALEGEFGLTLDTGEMLGLTSFEAIRLFLEERGL